MPKSYRFHPYNVNKRTPGTALRETNKEKLAQSHVESHHTQDENSLHYGRKFAETERLAHEHNEHPKMSRPHQAEGVIRSHELRGQPIGALPQTEEPLNPEMLQTEGWGDVVGEAIRGVQRLGGAVKDFSEATLKLARLPFDVAKLLGRRTRLA